MHNYAQMAASLASAAIALHSEREGLAPDSQAVLHLRPELIPIERRAELSLVTFHTVASSERTEMKRGISPSRALGNVNASGTVTALASDLGELGDPVLAAVTTRHFKTDGMAADAGGIGFGLGSNQGIECYGMEAIVPNLRGASVTPQTRFAPHELCR